ncbi:TPA: bifunctional nuclease family protein [Candidatus Galligastranaerophilus gallistercoris]|nr:bifunctional nuclease family protein [Candidatus Galligastranaerophilus gallistercoris]
MIEMRVMGIALDTRTGSPIIVLNDTENRKALPIWIGSAEASSIIRKIENIPSSRPLTHDLFINFARQAGFKITRIEINDVDEQTYFSSIFLEDSNGKETEVDSRPSDAIAIAIRADVPILVSAAVMADGAISTDSKKDEEETAEFKNFIKDIKPSDFAKLVDKNFESDQ